jgi:16S rRNA (adenine1518-N6/adenine1519-N6)-dimethyltransferase
VLDERSRPRFFNMLHAGFSEPRKQLHNAIGNSLALPGPTVLEVLGEAGIAPDVRAQHLNLDDWRRLHAVLEARHPRTLDER